MTLANTAAVALALLALAGCAKPNNSAFQGWVEGDFIFVGPDEAGRLETLSVREGQWIKAAAPLFSLDDELQRADVMQATATAVNARQTLQRAEQLVKAMAGTQKAYDDAQAALREAEARLNSAQTRLARRRVVSPGDGNIHQVYYRPGEMVPAGRPVVSLLPPANIKVRFFVPEAELPRIAIDQPVAVSCDNCPPDLTARISFIARTAEYTPPVIYSLEERAKLVFLIEAKPERPQDLRVGQPVSVALTAAQEAKRR
jgi:HlyD family secretion protein